ncbi:MAG: PDZ domain-containing protein [Anaerolineae bacterium]|nr:PDZ domain-containing protein [Anaerolineae bacterium]
MRKSIAVLLLALTALAVTAGVIAAQDTDTTSTKTWLGVALVEENDQVIVARVQSGSPADTADLQVGDVIVSFNGTAVATAAQLAELVQAAAPGDTATLEVQRNNESVNIDVVLGSASVNDRPGRMEGLALPEDALSLVQMFVNADLTEATGGFEVSNVLKSNNPYGLEIGDVITAINDQPATDFTLENMSMGMARGGGITLTVTRGSETVTLEGDMMGMFFHFGPFMERGMGHGMDGFGPRDGRGGRNGQGSSDAAPALPSAGQT